MFGKAGSGKDSFLEQTKHAREERALEKQRENAIVLIQSQMRGCLARRAYQRRCTADFERLLEGPDNELKPSLQVFSVAGRLLTRLNVDKQEHRDQLERLCKYLLRSIETADTAKFSYVGVALHKDHSLAWIKHIKALLYKCCLCVELLKPECHVDSLSLAVYLHTLVAFTSPNTWLVLKTNKQLAGLKPGMHQMCANIMGGLVQKGFFGSLKSVLLKGICRNNISLKPITLTAILTLATRPLVSGGFTDNLMTMFLVNIMTVPALVHQIDALTPDFVPKLVEMELLGKSVQLLNDPAGMRVITNSGQGTQILALLANLIHLFNLESVAVATKMGFPDFTVSRSLQIVKECKYIN